jgi:hypothetical protein
MRTPRCLSRLRLFRRAAFLALGAALVWPTLLWAQQMGTTGYGVPHLLLVQPAGGRAGTTVDVTLIGKSLDPVQGLYFSQPGIRAELIAPVTVTVEKGAKMKKKQPKGPPRTGLRFKVHIPEDTPLGIHDVRVVTAGGISNARAFLVGDHKEYVEKEPNDDVPQAQAVELNGAVHGTINNPTDVDYYRFDGQKGQRVVVSCLASSIDSKLEPAIELYSPAGALLALGRGYHRGEALGDAVLPEDGAYLVRVCSFTYTQGGQDYFYRLSISTAPWIDAVFPPVVEPGKKTAVTVYGRNLPAGKADPNAVVDGRVLEKAVVMVDVPADPAALQRLRFSGRVEPFAASMDGFELRLHNEAGASNPFLLTFAHAPVILDQGDNDTAEKAQEVPVPCEIAGRIEKRGDQDWYAFEAKKGDVLSIELFGERLGAPVDMQLAVYRTDKEQKLVELDDNPEVFLPQILTRTDDPPRYRFVAPADGRYQVHVTSSDAFVQAGPRHLYRLRIAPEQPDFRLLVLPPLANALDACVVPQAGHQLYTVLAWRLDGFKDEIRLSATGLPAGVTCPPQVVPPGSKVAFLVLSASQEAPPWAGAIQVRGTATIKGREVVREARPAGATWPVPQANLPALARLDHSLVLAVGGPAAYTLTAEAAPRVALPGKKVTVPVRLSRTWPELKGKPIQLTPIALPPALTFQQFTFAPGKDTADVSFTIKPNAEPGTYSVVLRGQVQVNKADKKRKKNANLNLQLPSTPITISVLPKELARLSVGGKLQVKAGRETELVVKAARLHGYEGPLEVKLILPPGVRGLEPAEATIPAGASEVRLTLRAEPGAAIGARNNLIVRAVGMYQGKVRTSQETKVNVNVVK